MSLQSQVTLFWSQFGIRSLKPRWPCSSTQQPGLQSHQEELGPLWGRVYAEHWLSFVGDYRSGITTLHVVSHVTLMTVLGADSVPHTTAHFSELFCILAILSFFELLVHSYIFFLELFGFIFVIFKFFLFLWMSNYFYKGLNSFAHLVLYFILFKNISKD